MKKKIMKYMQVAVLLALSVCVVSCVKESRPFPNVDRSALMPYVECSETCVESMLECMAVRRCFTFSDIGLNREDVEDLVREVYGDTVDLFIAFQDAHSVTADFDEVADVAFVWHTAMTSMRKDYLRSKGEMDSDKNVAGLSKAMYNLLFDHYCDDPFMKVSSWLFVSINQYDLLSAYVKLAEACDDDNVRKLVHDDYAHASKIFSEFHHQKLNEMDSAYCPSRELGETYCEILKAKQKWVEKMMKQEVKGGKVNVEAVKRELKIHGMITDEGKECDLTPEVVTKIFDLLS